MHVPMLFDCLLFAMLGAGSRDHVTTPKMLLRRHGGPFQGLGHLPCGGGLDTIKPEIWNFGPMSQQNLGDTLPYIAVNGSKWFVRIMIGPFDLDLYVLLHINL